MSLNKIEKKCGFVAIVGRPNVGKSTLLNHLVGQKLSITSRKPQTTRHRLLGISTSEEAQIIYVDTPGLHSGDKSAEKALNRYMNNTVLTTLHDVDLVLFVVEAEQWREADQVVLSALEHVKVPVLLLLNKVDQVEDRAGLLPVIENLSEKHVFQEIIPVSALKGHNLEQIEEQIKAYLPESVFLFPEDQITDKNSRFLAAEFVREKITRQLGQELPYGVTVEIEEFSYDERDILHIRALVLVEREGQKRIIIGSKGDRLKLIGIEARKEMERLFASKVMLNLWVKVKAGWSDDERALKSLGYEDL